MSNDNFWYVATDKDVEEIQKLLRNHGTKLNKVLNSFSIKKLEFATNFKEYFEMNKKEICNLATGKNKLFYIKKLGGGKIGEVFTISKSNNKNNVLAILKSIKNVGARPNYLAVRINDYTVEQAMMNPSLLENIFLNQDGLPKALSIISKDNFTNQTLMHIILNNILKNNPNYLYQFDAFWCNKVGYNITELCNQGDMHEYFEKNGVDSFGLFDSLKQITNALSILKSNEYSFVHADLKARNVFVTKEDNKIIFKIADFDKSSITWKGFRFYNGTYDYHNFIKTFQTGIQVAQGYQSIVGNLAGLISGSAKQAIKAIPKSKGYITDPYPIFLNKNGKKVYKLTSTFIEKKTGVPAIQMYTMHNPFGFYLSYDFYTLMISLLAIKYKGNFVIRDKISKLTDEYIKFLEILLYSNFNYTFSEHILSIDKDLTKWEWIFQLFLYLFEGGDLLKIINHSNLEDFVSLGKINKFITENEISFLYDISGVYKCFKNPIINKRGIIEMKFIQSKNSHICVDKCTNGKCKTNPYGGTVYGIKNSDTC
jgi:hypothetical protein